MKRVYSALHSKSGQTIRIHSFKKFRRIIPSVKLIQNIFFSLRFFVKWYQMPAPKFDLSCWEIKKKVKTRGEEHSVHCLKLWLQIDRIKPKQTQWKFCVIEFFLHNCTISLSLWVFIFNFDFIVFVCIFY